MRMRQKVSISQLPIRLGIFLLLYLVPQSLSAQENNDSTHILRNGASHNAGRRTKTGQH